MILLFGGSFDPVHLGHLDLARRALARYRPQKLYLIPTKKNPLKDFAPGANAFDRLHMAELTAHELGSSETEVADWEIRREGTSYTWDTVQVVKHLNKDPDITLVLGDEVFQTFPHWHRCQELVKEVNIVVCSRQTPLSKLQIERTLTQCGIRDGHWEHSAHPGEARYSHTHSRRWIETMTFEAIPVSGSEIREILTTYRGSVRPPGLSDSVWDYIKKSNLYSVK